MLVKITATCEQDFEVRQPMKRILTDVTKNFRKHLGGSGGRLGRVRPQQKGRGGPWASPGHVLIDSACLRPLGVVLAAEHHRS